MFRTQQQTTDIFSRGFQSVQRGLWSLGAVLVTLAILIFFFPALIGFLFAGFILMAGIAILVSGYRFYRFRKGLEEWEHPSRPRVTTFRTEGPHYTARRVTIVMK